MQGNYFDIGVNLTHESFNSDYRVVINDEILKNIKKIYLKEISIEDSKKCIEIANEFKKNLICTVGIHPHNACYFDESSNNKILEHKSPVKAIGEAGLDFNRIFLVKKIK